MWVLNYITFYCRSFSYHNPPPSLMEVIFWDSERVVGLSILIWQIKIKSREFMFIFYVNSNWPSSLKSSLHVKKLFRFCQLNFQWESQSFFLSALLISIMEKSQALVWKNKINNIEKGLAVINKWLLEESKKKKEFRNKFSLEISSRILANVS